MKRLYALTLLLSTTLATGALAAADTTPAHNIVTETTHNEATGTDKVSSLITLNETTSDYILQAFGLDVCVGPAMTLNGQPLPVIKDNPQIPAGVESVLPAASENRLLITGTKKGVEELLARIILADVKPRIVKVVAEYYEVDAELDKDIAPLVENVGDPGVATAVSQKTFKDKLKAAGISPLHTSILSTLDRTSGELSAQLMIPSTGPSADEKSLTMGISLSATPRIYEDKSIGVTLNASFNNWMWDSDEGIYLKHSQSLSGNRRTPSGEPFVAGGFTLRPGKTTIILITPTIVD